MKGLHALFIIAIAMVVFALPSCGDAPTEVGWENSYSSIGPIQEIIWADGDQVWNSQYDKEQRTGTKKVNELNGMVECKVDADGGVGTALLYIEETNSQSLSLNPGESAIYTINATGKI